MQKEYVEKIIVRICTGIESLYSYSPKVSPAKVIPDFILLLELLSMNTENEERVNRILQDYYFSEYIEEMWYEFQFEMREKKLFRGKSFAERHDFCNSILQDLKVSPDLVNERQLFRLIKGGQGAHAIKIPNEFKIKFCDYLGLDPAVYFPDKASYSDYWLQRQQELMKLLEDSNDEPDIQYQRMTNDLKEALFNKFSSFVEKINNDAWEGKIDQDNLCSETQALTTDLNEYRKIINS